MAPSPTQAGWIDVDYDALVDRRRLSHSGESVGMLLQRLGGRSLPPKGERPDDLTAYVLLDPLLEPYAFVLPDLVDSLSPPAAQPFVEIGQLWQPGEAQPAWAELLRARRFVVEGDGMGRMRLFLPWSPAGRSAPTGAVDPAAPPPVPSVESPEAAKQALASAWPVLRHVFAAERMRLARKAGDKPENHPLDADVYAFVARPARTQFQLGVRPFHIRIDETSIPGEAAPVDLAAWRDFLAGGLQLEGGRLTEDGSVLLLGSARETKPAFLGRPPQLADLAVAYRAVFHGGLGEPYMSLDRGGSPQTSLVNYGGRLQDTSLGLVSLLCDIRFKTFSLGIDILGDQDLRERIRADVPAFRTHMERLASDPRSKGLFTQQTRLWFYPDSVDLTLSPEDDVLVVRRARMSASSERVAQETFQAAKEPDPPWTVDTVAAINADYSVLSRFFPELSDLDQVVRMLSFFAWLKQAGTEGWPLPDLDALLALDLPAQPTPRTFPQLLTYSLLPPSGQPGPVQVFNRESVGESLDRLLPADGSEFTARVRFQRALAALERRAADQAKLATELESYDSGTLDDSTLDLLSYRAERLRMHYLVHNTLPASDRDIVEKRKAEVAGTHSLETGIGGLDLGMSQALARATARNERGASAGGESGSTAAAASAAAKAAAARARSRAGERRAATPAAASPVPDYGLESGGRAGTPGAKGAAAGLKEYRGQWVQSAPASGASPGWIETVSGADGPDPRLRRLILGASGPARAIERLEGERFLRFTFAAQGARVQARTLDAGLPAAAAEIASDPRGLLRAASGGEVSGELPSGLAQLEVLPAQPAAATDAGSAAAGAVAPAGGEAASVRLKLRGIAGRDLEAAVPRQVLQRLVLGHDADLTPDRPLPGLSPGAKVLAGAAHLMVLQPRERSLPPWTGPRAPQAGEENAARLAAALGRWWLGEEGAQAPRVFVGTDAQRSIERWRGVSGLAARPLLLLPEDAFPGTAAPLRAQLAGLWKAGEVAPALPAGQAPGLVVLVSAEEPALLGARLRELAVNGAMKGRLLAVYPLGGPVRPDLPASLLAEGRLSGIGISEYNPLEAGRITQRLQALAAALAAPDARQKRPEDLPPPLLWYF